MYRVSRWLRRTSSRNTAGARQTPLFGGMSGGHMGPSSSSSSSSSSAAAAAARAAAAAAAARDPAQYNWKANPALREFMAGRNGDDGSAHEAYTHRTQQARKQQPQQRHSRSGSSSSSSSKKDDNDDDDVQRQALWGKQDTFVKLVTGSFSFDKSSKDDEFGQAPFAGTSSRVNRYTDRGAVAPTVHDQEVDYLRSMQVLQSPSGKVCSASVLQDRLVGLLFFNNTQRSSSFLRRLHSFVQRHTPDVVVVAVSVEEHEMTDVSRACGFLHCMRQHGGSRLQQDAGLLTVNLLPLPRLLIIDTTTNTLITRSGVTAVSTQPDTCLSAWRCGEPGFTWRDRLRMLFM